MFRDLAAGLVERGHSPWLITSHPQRPTTTFEASVRVTRNWRPPDGRLLRRAYEEHLTHVPASYLSLRRGSADIAHASHAPDAVAAARWSRERGAPAVFSFMGLPDREWLVARRMRLDLMIRAIRGCAAVVALSRAAAEVFADTLGVEARVIHPGVDVETFTPGPERSEAPSIVCAAPLDVPEKRVSLLLEALPLVRRARPTASVILQRPADASLAAALQATPGVQVIDPAPELLLDAFRRAWVSALPSRREPFGLVLVESLACGTPVVGSDRGAIPEIVDRPEIGRLFSGEQPEAVATALLEALELAGDPATALACRRRAEELSLERCVDAYEALYLELIS
jgi:phosphatidylinositol alpha-mannosyltransferase